VKEVIKIWLLPALCEMNCSGAEFWNMRIWSSEKGNSQEEEEVERIFFSFLI
jgi:hypothetical protein